MEIHQRTCEDASGMVAIPNHNMETHRARAAEAIERFYNPGTISDCTDLFEACEEGQRYKYAHRLVRTLERRKAVKMVGVARLPGKRAQLVYCSRNLKQRELQHELGITEMYLAIASVTPVQMARGRDVNNAYRADIEFRIHDTHVLGEYDTGTEGHTQVKGRWDVLSTAAAKILWVTSTEERATNLSAIDHPIRPYMRIVALTLLLHAPERVVEWVGS